LGHTGVNENSRDGVEALRVSSFFCVNNGPSLIQNNDHFQVPRIDMSDKSPNLPSPVQQNIGCRLSPNRCQWPFFLFVGIRTYMYIVEQTCYEFWYFLM
jgi:hypothetical protein